MTTQSTIAHVICQLYIWVIKKTTSIHLSDTDLAFNAKYNKVLQSILKNIFYDNGYSKRPRS